MESIEEISEIFRLINETPTNLESINTQLTQLKTNMTKINDPKEKHIINDIIHYLELIILTKVGHDLSEQVNTSIVKKFTTSGHIILPKSHIGKKILYIVED